MQSDMINVYFAILNQGWLRRELVYNVLGVIMDTKGVTTHFENPELTYHHPISSNRNRITKRFLKTDCDFLLMLDNDVVPYQNPVELVYANQDIIGVPAKVRQKNRNMNWVAYIKPEELKDSDGYYPLDFSVIDSQFDLMPVDIVGTGCILIKRKVLEAMKAPFNCEYDEDGVTKYGTDFAFCKRAKAAGFNVFTTTNRFAEHFKEVGLNDITGYDDSDNRDIAPAKYTIPWGGFAISMKDWHFIKKIIDDTKPEKILEFGAGLSSLLMSESTDVVTYETDDKYIEEIESKTNGNRLIIKKWDGKDIEDNSSYDLAFVDGPLGELNGGPGRENSIRLASELSDKIIVHDAGRQHELMWQNKYLKRDFKMIGKSGHHVSRCHYWERRAVT